MFKLSKNQARKQPATLQLLEAGYVIDLKPHAHSHVENMPLGKQPIAFTSLLLLIPTEEEEISHSEK